MVKHLSLDLVAGALLAPLLCPARHVLRVLTETVDGALAAFDSDCDDDPGQTPGPTIPGPGS